MSAPRTETASNARPVIGYAAAGSLMLIWSVWLVTSRAGVQSNLTPYDLVAFRFGIAGLLTLPIILYVKPWRGMSLGQIVTVTLVSGIPYTLPLFLAFDYAPAAHGAVFMNGLLPALTMVGALLLFSEPPRAAQIIGSVLVLTGAGLAAFGTVGFDFFETWKGDLLFMIAAAFFTTYLMLNRLWHISVTQIWLCGSLLNAPLYVPLWWLFLPSGIADTEFPQLAWQLAFQGIVPNIFGFVLVAFAVRHAGPSATAAIMSGVPAVGALLGAIFLGEQLNSLGIASLCVLTPGIIIASIKRAA